MHSLKMMKMYYNTEPLPLCEQVEKTDYKTDPRARTHFPIENTYQYFLYFP